MRKPRPTFRRSLRSFDQLEDRRLLAGDVVGTVLNDTDGDGVGETASVGQPVVLYNDDGASVGVFDGTDTVRDTVNTTAGGAYRFADVPTGDYFVQLGTLTNQIEINAPGTPLLLSVGDVNIVVDDFTADNSFTVRRLSAVDPLPISDSTTFDVVGGSVLGDEQDFFVEITDSDGEGDITVASGVGRLAGDVLNISSDVGFNGRVVSTWDGDDGDGDEAAVGSFTVAQDLTQAGANDAIAFAINADNKPTASITLRVFNGASSFERELLFSQIAGIGDGRTTVSVPFTDFAGNPDFTAVTAVQLEVNFEDAAADGLDADIELLGIVGDTAGPDLEVQNVMSLGDLVFLDVNNNGMFDAGQDTGIDGVLLTLLEANDADGLFDDVVQTQRTTAGGQYLFTGLAPGEYKVRVDATNFDLADADLDDALAGLFSSTGNDDAMGMAPDPDADTDNDKDRGTLEGADVCSKPITLVGGAESADNGNRAPNVDFGFYGFDLRIDKTPATQEAAAGATVTYTLTPRNQRPTGNPTNLGTDAANVVVTDTLPTGLTFEAASSTAGAAVATVGGRQVVTYNIGGLAAGTTGAPITVVARLDAGLTVAPAESNEARVSDADEPAVFANQVIDDNLDQAAITLAAPLVDLQVDKSVTPNTDVVPGTTVTYTVQVSHGPTSNATATSYDLVDDLPAGLTFVSTITAGLPVPTQVANAGGGTRLTYTGLPALALGSTQTIQYTATIDADYVGPNLVNNAQIESILPIDTDPTNNADPATVTLFRTLPTKRDFFATTLGLV